MFNPERINKCHKNPLTEMELLFIRTTVRSISKSPARSAHNLDKAGHIKAYRAILLRNKGYSFKQIAKLQNRSAERVVQRVDRLTRILVRRSIGLQTHINTRGLSFTK